MKFISFKIMKSEKFSVHSVFFKTFMLQVEMTSQDVMIAGDFPNSAKKNWDGHPGAFCLFRNEWPLEMSLTFSMGKNSFFVSLFYPLEETSLCILTRATIW